VTCVHSPLVQKVAERIYDIWFAEFILYEFHNAGEVGLTHVLTVYDFGHKDGKVVVR
jgi:hypothetical protein